MLAKSANPLHRMVYASLFGALTAAGSLIVIPMQPVPITLQTLFTCLSGILLGARAGGLSQIIYVLLGIIGLPVFAGGKAGAGVLFGPSGGYLIGFVVGAYVMGKIVEIRREPGWVWLLMALLVGNLIIYTLGTWQLMEVTGFSLVKSLMVGVVPFLFGDLLKIVATAWLGVKISKHFNL
ncbi:MAG: biotin transporter BioY [Syntrophomonas sp.]